MVAGVVEIGNGIPGVFKNASDWLSRSSEDIPRVFGDRPFAVTGGSPGGFGTVLAQSAWLPVLRTLRGRYWSGGRWLLSRAHQLMDANGELADPAAREQLEVFVQDFAGFAQPAI